VVCRTSIVSNRRNPQQALHGAPAPTDVFRAAGYDIPHLSAALIDKYVADLQLLGLISWPSRLS
jgi:fatty acid CoA ligase FadD9